MKLYHYSKPNSWDKIKQGSYWSDNIPGLGANRRLGKEYIEAWIQTAVFMLLEPEPDSWVHNNHFPEIWRNLKKETGELLLEISPKKIDNYYVLDWGYREGFLSNTPEYLRRMGGNIPLRYLKQSRLESEQAYIESKIPLETFMKNKSLQHRYSIPEVISHSTIPIEEISISRFQPKLIDNEGRPLDDYSRDIILRIPELNHLLDD